GLGILYRGGERWAAAAALPALQEGYVQSIAEDAAGTLWLGTVFSGLIRVTGAGADWAENAVVERIGAEMGLPVREHLVVRFEGGQVRVDSPGGNYRMEDPSGRFVPREPDSVEAPLPGWAWDVSIADSGGRRWGSIYPLGGASDDFNLYFGMRTPGTGATPAQWRWIPPGLFDPIGGVLRLFLEEEQGAPVLWVGGWSGLLRWELDKAGPSVHVNSGAGRVHESRRQQDGPARAATPAAAASAATTAPRRRPRRCGWSRRSRRFQSMRPGQAADSNSRRFPIIPDARAGVA
ncbi:MAG: hypothetical protein ACP5I4_16235, partial [Oceanipulchritudo sp.]